MTRVTKKEMKFLNQIKNSDFSYDGNGLFDCIDDYKYNMKSVRGLIPSLVKKGIIEYGENSCITDAKGRYMSWAYINDEYQDIKNHKLKNIYKKPSK